MQLAPRCNNPNDPSGIAPISFGKTFINFLESLPIILGDFIGTWPWPIGSGSFCIE